MIAPRLGLPLRIVNFGRVAAPAPRRTLGRPRLGQSKVLDNRVVGFITNASAAVVGGIAGYKFQGAWSTVGWVVAVLASLRALNDLSDLSNGGS